MGTDIFQERDGFALVLMQFHILSFLLDRKILELRDHLERV